MSFAMVFASVVLPTCRAPSKATAGTCAIVACSLSVIWRSNIPCILGVMLRIYKVFMGDQLSIRVLLMPASARHCLPLPSHSHSIVNKPSKCCTGNKLAFTGNMNTMKNTIINNSSKNILRYFTTWPNKQDWNSA